MEVVRVLGWNVRAHRKRLGLSQEELGFRVNLMRSYISDLERGTRNPSVRVVGRIADALGVEPAALLAYGHPETDDTPGKP